MKKTTTILLFVIIFLAIFLRFFNLSYIEFNADQALNPMLAQGIMQNGIVQDSCLLSSAGVCNPPLFLYLLIPPLLISSNPLFLTGFIALLNVLSVILLFFFVKRFFGKLSALISSALLAVSPWAILFSRTIWQQNVLILFVILFVWSFFEFAFKDKKNYLIWAIVLLGIIIQLHQLGVLLLPVFVAGLIVFRKNVIFKNILIGFLICLLTITPFVVYLIQNDWYSIDNIFAYQEKVTEFKPNSLMYPLQLSSTLGFDYTIGVDLINFEKQAYSFFWFDILIVISFLSCLIASLLKPKSKVFWLALLYLSIPIFLIFSKSTIHPHYFIAGIPLGFVILSSQIQKIPKKKVKMLANIFLLLIVIYMICFSVAYLNFVASKQCIDGNHSQPYVYKEASISSVWETGERNFWAIHTKSCGCRICVPWTTKYILDEVILNHE